MTRDVLIRLSGLQSIDGEEGEVEVITAGDYFLKNEKHYLIYEEVVEGMEGTIRNTMKLTPTKLEIRKSGPVSANMVFETDKKSQTHYATPLGEMFVEMTTKRIDFSEEEDHLRVEVEYSLDVNYDHLSECRIVLDVTSRAVPDWNFQNKNKSGGRRTESSASAFSLRSKLLFKSCKETFFFGACGMDPPRTLLISVM